MRRTGNAKGSAGAASSILMAATFGKNKRAPTISRFLVEKGGRAGVHNNLGVNQSLVICARFLDSSDPDRTIAHGQLHGDVHAGFTNRMHEPFDLHPLAILGSCHQPRKSHARSGNRYMRFSNDSYGGVLYNGSKISGSTQAGDLHQGAGPQRKYRPRGDRDEYPATGVLNEKRTMPRVDVRIVVGYDGS